MPIEINGNTYKSKRHFFDSVFPDCEKATVNEIDFYIITLQNIMRKRKHITERNIVNKRTIKCAIT